MISDYIFLNRVYHHSYFPYILGFIVTLLYIAPVLIQWEDAPVLNHDCLDSNIACYSLLGHSNIVFGSYDKTINQMMGGIPRNLFPSELNVLTLLFSICDPLTAYFINFTVVHLTAFIGMVLLLLKVLPESASKPYITSGISCAYALLPFYPTFGLSIAGMPLIIYCFFSIIHKGWTFNSLFLIIIYSLYSNGFITGYFLLPILFLCSVVISWYQRSILWRGFLAVFLMGLLFFICDYRLFWEMFLNKAYVSHRSEFFSQGVPLYDTLHEGFEILSSGELHAASLHQLIVPILWISLTLILLKDYLKKNHISNSILFCGGLFLLGLMLSMIYPGINETCINYILWGTIIPFLFLIIWYIIKKTSIESFSKNELIIIGSTALVIIFSIIYLIQSWDFYVLTIQSQFFILNALQLRFYTLLPFIWYLLFGVCAIYIGNHSHKGHYIVYGVILFQIIFLFSFHGGAYQTGGVGNLFDNQFSFQEFYSPEIFKNIQKDIGLEQNSYRVGSIGIHPGISLYNGFYTIDGYFSNYPLTYKKKFRVIIAPELNKSEKWRDYYDKWGSRAYLFASELNATTYTKGNGIILHNLDLNTTAFKKLGGRYIFSAVNIETKNTNLSLEGIYSSEKSPWEIRVYSVQ